MATDNDVLFGQIAVRLRIIQDEHLDQCLEIQREEAKSGEPRRIGEILVAQGCMTPVQVEMITEEQQKARKPRTIGPYTLDRRLGQGAMGEVYKGVIGATGKDVAIKVLPRYFSDDTEYVQRFRREATVGLELDHPNIVSTLDFGEDDGMQYMVMERMRGGDLDNLLDQQNVLKERQALVVIHDICKGLQHAHERGLVHRDIKPSNLLLNSDCHVKVADFGLARSIADVKQGPNPVLTDYVATRWCVARPADECDRPRNSAA